MDRREFRSRTIRDLRCLTGVVLLAIIATGTVRAQSPGAGDSITVPRFLDEASGQEVRLPTAAINSLGWTLRIRASSQSTADTMRIELEFAVTGGPTTAEHQLEVRLTPMASGHSPPQSSVRVSLPLQIPQGVDRIRFARHVPKTSFGNLYRVELFEDGRSVPDGDATFGQPLVDPDYAVYRDETQQNACERYGSSRMPMKLSGKNRCSSGHY